MLVSFSVSNFRSFGDEETLNMVASNKLTEHPNHLVPIPGTGKSVLRTALLYGANAAGKSNLVRAMRFAQRMIETQGEEIRGVDSFRFDAESATPPSSFEFRFLISGRVFVYGFDITSKRICGEWLSVVKGDDELVVFERDEADNARIESKTRSLLADELTFTTLEKLISLPLRPDQLLLNRAIGIGLPDSVQGPTLSAVIRWLTRNLVILNPDHRESDILDRLDDDDNFCTFAGRFLEGVGTGVGKLKLEKTERDASDYERRLLKDGGSLKRTGRSRESDVVPMVDGSNRVISRRLIAEHPLPSGSGRLSFSEESDGTRQLLHLMPVLDSPPDEGRVVVIDELDRSLHPLICWEFLRFFSETTPGEHKQLIVTTHEAHLLNQDLLRRDEYWFVEKDAKQQSRLVSLSDFKVRNDLQVEKGYLQGRFGAIPVIGSMTALEQLLQARSTGDIANASQKATS